MSRSFRRRTERRSSCAETVLPTRILEEDGEHFRAALRDDATWDRQRFPVARLCAGRWARIAADHGANELSPADTLSALARCRDDPGVGVGRRRVRAGSSSTRCSSSRRRSGRAPRSKIGSSSSHRARAEPLFPVHRHDDDRTLDRVVLGDTPAFFPPQSARTAIALPDLRFMCHALCWGALNKKERAELLDDRMNAWASLFGVREFRFETVVQAAVLPALVLKPDDEALGASRGAARLAMHSRRSANSPVASPSRTGRCATSGSRATAPW